MLSCGGTGGHVTPALAIAQELSDQFTCEFLGSGSREDRRIIAKYAFKFTPFCEDRPQLKTIISHVLTCKKHLEATQSTALICTGGSQTLYPALAAKWLGLPIFVLEQNTIPGQTNRLLAKIATQIYTTYPESLPFFPKHKTKVWGNPIRKHFPTDSVIDAISALSIPEKNVILVVGGSQGALALNQLIHQNYPFFLNSPYTLLHLTGPNYYASHFTQSPITVQLDQNNTPKIITVPYSEDMATLYQKSQQIICRSGATTLAELEAFQKPAILIPYPHAKDNHQVHNAKQFCAHFPGVTIEEKDLSFNKLTTHIEYLMHAKFPEKPDQKNPRVTIATDIATRITNP